MTGRRFLAVWILSAGTLGAVGEAPGGGLRDLDDAWLIGPEAVVVMLEDAAVARGSWSCQLAQGRLYGMAELEQVGLRLERRLPFAVIAAAWERLGRDLYREDRWSLALMLGGGLRLGLRLGAGTLRLGGVPWDRQPACDLALEVPLSGGSSLQAWLPLLPAPAWYGEHGLRRWLLLQGGREAWLWALAVDRDPVGKPVLQGEVMLRLAPQAALGLRGEPASGTVALCTAWRAGRLVLRSSHALHPDLGPSHRWGLVFGAQR